MITELERRKRHISYDSLAILNYKSNLPKLEEFKSFYKNKTGIELLEKNLISMELLKQERDGILPTNALLLLSEKEIRKIYFPFAQIECARFKGISTAEIIDQMSCNSPIILQAEEAIRFIKRNIAKHSTIGDVYREDKWEYPIEAIREVVINAIIHRDYSILGSDIKIAIFDDMLEITSPGTLMPSFDLNDIKNNPSEIRNKVLAPIFKDCRLIEKWGSGFKKIIEQMQSYPDLELKILEPSNATQVQFLKKNYVTNNNKMSDKTSDKVTDKIIELIAKDNHTTIKELAYNLELSKRTIERHLKQMQETEIIKRIGPKKGGYWEII